MFYKELFGTDTYLQGGIRTDELGLVSMSLFARGNLIYKIASFTVSNSGIFQEDGFEVGVLLQCVSMISRILSIFFILKMERSNKSDGMVTRF